MTAIMLLFVMASALPAPQAVTQDEIDDMKSQASSLKEQQADLQSKLDELENSQNVALDQKFLLEEKINVLQEQIALSEQAIQDYGEMIDQKEVELAEAQEEEAKYQEEFNQRVRSMEERGMCPIGPFSSMPTAFRTCWTRSTPFRKSWIMTTR